MPSNLINKIKKLSFANKIMSMLGILAIVVPILALFFEDKTTSVKFNSDNSSTTTTNSTTTINNPTTNITFNQYYIQDEQPKKTASYQGPERQTYTIENPPSHATLNSIINNPVHGDERNFVQVRNKNFENETYADQIDLEAGGEYVVYAYYHNSADTDAARNTFVRAEIPAVVPAGTSEVKGVVYIDAENTTPTEVWDDVGFSNPTNGDIALRYVPGSATIHNFGLTNGSALSDDIITSGASIGFNALDGIVPGGVEFAGYITFRIIANQPDFIIEKQVRLKGSSEWKKSVSAKSGDIIEYRIQYINSGTTAQNNVVLKNILSAHTSYLDGSTTLKNSSYPNGKSVSDNLVQEGINIGNYSPRSNAYIKFSARIDNIDSLPCGTSRLMDTIEAQTTDDNKQDKAFIVLVNECE